MHEGCIIAKQFDFHLERTKRFTLLHWLTLQEKWHVLIAFFLLYFALRLIPKTRATFSTDQKT